MPVTKDDALGLTDQEIDDIIGWHEALGIWADDLNDLINWKAARAQEGNQGEAVGVRNFRGRIGRLIAKLVPARRRSRPIRQRTQPHSLL